MLEKSQKSNKLEEGVEMKVNNGQCPVKFIFHIV